MYCPPPHKVAKMHVDDQLLWHDVLAAVLLKYGGKTLPHAASPGPVEALALQLVKSSYGPDGYRLFLKPSDSWNGWLGVSSTHAAQAAVPARVRVRP